MKQQHPQLRRAAALLLAAAALPFTPLAAQDVVPSVTAPPPPAATAPPEAAPAPAAPAVTMGPTAAVRGEPVIHTAPTPESSAAPASRVARAVAPAARAAAPRAARSSSPAPVASRPSPTATAATPAGVTATAAPSLGARSPAATAPVPVTTPVGAASESTVPDSMSWWPFAAGAALLAILAAGLIAMRRRRRAEEEVYYEEPAYAAEPVAVEPVAAAPVAADPAHAVAPLVAPTRAVHEPEVLAAAAASSGVQSVAAPDRADLEALAATSGTHSDRPWLEFLMRPVRAGAGEDETRVEFELTVGNTGDAPAKDVRVSTWMVAGAAASDMERGLIEAPAGAASSELSIPAHDGALVEGSLALPREGADRAILPVVVAEARYRLPDGSEGRTAASFAVGLADGDTLEPLSVDAYGLRDDIEARLHGEPERV